MEPTTTLAGSHRRDEPEVLWRLVRHPPKVDASHTCAEVNAIFRRDPQQSSVIVRFPGGESHLLPKRQFLEGITGAYGWAINGGRPVGRLVDYTALTLPPEMGLTDASAAILARDQRIRYDDVLVQGDRDRAVFGAVSVADLLDRLAYLHAQQARMAMHAAEAERESARRLRVALEREHAANEHLRTLDELKTTFMQAVSHDLRTPLASVLGFAVTLERHYLALPPEQIEELLNRLASNARRLDRIVVDLLDLDRLSRGAAEPHREPTDLARLAERVVAELDGLGGHEVSVEAPPLVAEVDAAKVERILENLLTNAVRHTGGGTAVWVRIAARDGGVLLAVEDNGPGVPASLRDAVFQPFRRGPTASPHAPGSGVGLALVARFAALHGGHAWVEERRGGGASFRVALPCERWLASHEAAVHPGVH
jgi:signal transduction histidine kinase